MMGNNTETKRKQFVKETQEYLDQRKLEKEKYDLRPLANHPLQEWIATEVKIQKEKTVETAPIYQQCFAMILDDTSYNFHLFPQDATLYDDLNSCFSEFSENVKTEVKKIDKNRLKVRSSNGKYPRMRNIEDANPGEFPDSPTSKKVKIFCRYASIEQENCSYSAFPMRFSFGDGVDCTLQRVQFHKEVRKHINKGTRGKFDICYPENTDDYTYYINSAGNICFNPPVKFTDYNEVAKHFLFFVLENEKLFGALRNCDGNISEEAYSALFEKWEAELEKPQN